MQLLDLGLANLGELIEPRVAGLNERPSRRHRQLSW
jgi:hypothetical protein